MERTMHSQPQPPARTASKCIKQTERATHAFEVAGNILQPDVDVEEYFYVTSAAFVIGGYRWHLRFYPSNTDGCDDDDDKYASLFLELLTKGAKASVILVVRFVDQDTGSSRPIFRMVETVFTTMDSNYHNNWGRHKLMKRSDLYASAYLRDDRLLIECDVTVINEARALLDMSDDVDLPPSELSIHLAKLLQTKEGADVTFRVRRQKFRAHRIVLAARSLVFKAMLYGPVGEDSRECISVEDMQPAIFSTLLHFVYTDSLPSMEDLDDEESIEFAKHLLVAADRYDMERLKLICEGILCKGLDVQSMEAMLTMSMKYSCGKLEDACKKYIHPNRVEDAVPANQEVNRSALTVLWNRAFSLLRYVVPRFLFNNIW